MKNFIKRKIFIKADLNLETPLIIGSGESDITDMDLCRDYNNTPFIPATSFVGVLRDALSTYSDSDEIDKFLGESGENSKMSLMTVYDLFPENFDISIRDGVVLDYDNKVSIDKSKYDYEIIEPSAKFSLRMEINVRENTSLNIDKIIGKIILLIKEGKIRLGAKTTRGFGAIGIDNIKILDLDLTQKDNVKKLLDFDWNKFNDNKKENDFTANITLKDNFTTFKIEAKLDAPLIIGGLAGDEVDAESIKSNGKYVIPGTSIAGVFRYTAYNILNTLNMADKEKIIKNLFGIVDKEKREAKKSRIFFKEIIIEDAKAMKITHNKIDRFTAGTIETALFDEKPIVKGKFSMEIKIKNAKDYEKELIILVLKELDNGLSAIGGTTGIGKGIIKITKILVDNDSINLSNYSNFESLSKIVIGG